MTDTVWNSRFDEDDLVPPSSFSYRPGPIRLKSEGPDLGIYQPVKKLKLQYPPPPALYPGMPPTPEKADLIVVVIARCLEWLKIVGGFTTSGVDNDALLAKWLARYELYFQSDLLTRIYEATLPLRDVDRAAIAARGGGKSAFAPSCQNVFAAVKIKGGGVQFGTLKDAHRDPCFSTAPN